jgi:AcrR family transcriptional regulator
VTRAQTRDRVLRAAVRTLASHGYARTTARAIARTGGFAPGVIYYHFTDLEDLFLATARFTSQARLERYRTEINGLTGAVDLLRRLRRLYAEDSAEGHIAAVQELIAAATTSTRLAEQLRAETDIWRDFAETVLRRLLAGTPLAPLVPTRELATATVAAYLGIEMLSHLHPDRTTPEALFDAAERAATLADSLHGP